MTCLIVASTVIMITTVINQHRCSLCVFVLVLIAKHQVCYIPALIIQQRLIEGTLASIWECVCIVPQILIALVFWCWGNQIYKANCQNTSSCSSTAKLEGTCLPLLLWWHNNTKQVCSPRSDGSRMWAAGLIFPFITVRAKGMCENSQGW